MHPTGCRPYHCDDGLELGHVDGVGVLRAGRYTGDLTIELFGPRAVAACRPPNSDGASRACSGVLYCRIAAHID